MTRSVLVVVLAALLSPASTRAAEQELEVLFVADGAGPITYLEVRERSDDQTLVRSASWTFFAGGETVTKTTQDQLRATASAPLLVELPSPPAGLSVASDDDGTMLFTLDDLGDWQAALASGVDLKPAPGGPAVSSRKAARLLVEPPPSTLGRQGAWASQAVLYGTLGAVAGQAFVRTSAATRRHPVLVLPQEGQGLTSVDFGLGALASHRTFVVDRARACERAVPTAILLWPKGGVPTRLVASSAPGCLPSGRVIVPLSGVRLEARKDTPIRAVLVDEPPSGAASTGASTDRAARLGFR